VREPASKPKRGPRFKDIDPEVVDRLAAIHCTIDEIGAVVGCSRDTIERRFREQVETGKAKGRASLRRMQWKSAEAGNATMQIWLGKQCLEQTDKTTIHHGLDPDSPEAILLGLARQSIPGMKERPDSSDPTSN
jgi:hypothetical protein